eukprot:CAMPEP_0172197842 /NCGR_PEP_ID=MMETSP1050-20130122/27730_1 /TAXON_ID=233186 /ORGANISM="Cryptomonas curvata, Strain CCAP979/52" /LENGTH=73 /DNA_ID=CAMNT_0012874545 /DNA_START=1 /DNA_END=218 /DNA_ORIENTATION=-
MISATLAILDDPDAAALLGPQGLLCAELVKHNLVERLSIVFCWGVTPAPVKSRIAELMFHMGKCPVLADRIVR